MLSERAAFIDRLGVERDGVDEVRSRLLASRVLPDKQPQTGMLETTVGGALQRIPAQAPAVRRRGDGQEEAQRLRRICYELMGSEMTAEVVDEIKHLGFTYATVSA